MKTRHSFIVALFALAVVFQPLRGFADPTAPPQQLQDRATQLYASLTDEQKNDATLPLDSPERNKEVFTGGVRAGIQLRKLTDEQRKMALDLLTMFTSDYGKQKAIAISEQKPDNPADDPGIGRYY